MPFCFHADVTHFLEKKSNARSFNAVYPAWTSHPCDYCHIFSLKKLLSHLFIKKDHIQNSCINLAEGIDEKSRRLDCDGLCCYLLVVETGNVELISNVTYQENCYRVFCYDTLIWLFFLLQGYLIH